MARRSPAISPSRAAVHSAQVQVTGGRARRLARGTARPGEAVKRTGDGWGARARGMIGMVRSPAERRATPGGMFPASTDSARALQRRRSTGRGRGPPGKSV